MILYNPSGTALAEIAVDDNSYRYRAIMGDNALTLYFSLPQHLEIPIGAYTDFQGVRYTLVIPEALKMKHSRYFEYTVTMEGTEAKAKRWKFRNPVDGRLKFPLTAPPREHLQMFVDNMNSRDSGWSVGSCVEGVERLISYNHNYCIEALQLMAQQFDTEYEISGKVVSLKKVEYNKDAPLALSYGKGNGFKSGVGRSNSGDSLPVEILFVQGGGDNIDPSTYGGSNLLLPKGQTLGYDGNVFSYQAGYAPSNGRIYEASADGLSIRRNDKALDSRAEDSMDCSTICPKRVGTVSGVVTVDADRNFYDIVDSNIPEILNYNNYLIAGETMTIVFQSGMLAGREFEAKYIHEPVLNRSGEAVKAGRRFEIVPQDIDGQTMPNSAFKPVAGNTYAVFHCALPEAYIRDDETKTGASWDMFREAIRYMYSHEDRQFTFRGELDGIWAKKDWTNIGGKIVLGGYIEFSDERFQPDGVLVRIVGIKDYVNNPHSPTIELSNQTITGGFSSALKEMENEEVVTDQKISDAVQFTKRRYRDAIETISALKDAMLDFSEGINPVTVQTMAMLVGDESLQFRFVNSRTNPHPVNHSVSYDPTTKKLSCDAGILQHLTLGINTLSSSHAAAEYKYWDMTAYESAYLGDIAAYKFYLYAKVSKTARTGVFVLSRTAIGMDSVTGYYHLLVGILNSEFEDMRSYVSLYGYTEVLPGRVTVDKIVSSEGTTFWDLLRNTVSWGGKLMYNTEGNNELILSGSLIQTGNGEVTEVGAWCGEWDSGRRYALGDEVWCSVDGNVSSYRYINSVPSKGHSVTDENYWAAYAKGIKGDKGTDAESPVFADLDNETEAIALNSEGEATAQLRLVTNAALYYGTTHIALTGITVSGLPTGITESHDLGTGKVTFIVAKGASVGANVPIAIALTGEHDGESYTRNLTFTIAGVKSGAGGADAVIYSIQPSATSVKKDKNGSYSESQVSCARYKRTGNGDLRPTTDGTLKYRLDNGSEREYNSAVSTGSFKTSLTFLFYVGSVLVDKETVPLVYDGYDGSDGGDGYSVFKSIIFKRSDTRPDTPTSGSYENPVPASEGWSDGVPAGASKLWMSARVFSSPAGAPVETGWTTPGQVTDTETTDYEWSAKTSDPGTPDNPTSGADWHNEASSNDVWMAVRHITNGINGSWQVIKVKGESGADGKDSYSPYIGDNGNWYVYDDVRQRYVDSGRTSEGDDGHSPYIDSSTQTWWEWDAAQGNYTDTGIRAQGADGKGLASIDEYYQASADGSTAPTGEWTENAIPSDFGVNKKYLWNYEKITYSSGDPTTTPAAVIGVFGKDGKGISSIVEYYQAGTSATDEPTGVWTEGGTPSDFGASKPYLWNKEVITYSDGTMDETSPAMIGHYGMDGGSITVQYSADGADWHDTYTAGDLYMRQKIGGDSWSDAIRIVGEDGVDGVWTSIVFKRSDSQPNAPTDTSPVPTSEGWSDAPPPQGANWEKGDGAWTLSGDTLTSDKVAGGKSTWQKVMFTTYEPNSVLKVTMHASSEARYDWGYIGNLDSEASASSYKARVSGTDSITEVFTIAAAGAHYLYFGYVKDLSGDKNDDNVVVTIDAGAVGDLYMSKAAVANGVAGTWSFPVKLNGSDGANGVGVQSTTVSYNTSSSGTDVPVGGWSSEIPSVPPGFYLWTRTVITYTDGTSSTSYTAARQGTDGEDGHDGASGPAVVFRGTYESGKTYIGNSIRVDAVYYIDRYYVAKTTAGEFSGVIPTSTSKWNTFGASFDSIATGLLLSEEANIANFIFRNQRMVSQAGSEGKENLQLDGVNGVIRLADLLRLDSRALTMFSNGVEKVSVRNSSVGDYDLSLMKKSENISGQQSSVTVTTYLPSAGSYVNIGENKLVNKRLGHFDAGDKITATQGIITLSTPTVDVTTRFSAPTVQVSICKDGIPVSTQYIVASGTVTSGTSKRMELGGDLTYTVPSGGDGDYSIQLLTKGISVKSDSSAMAVTTSFTTLLSYSFNKASFAKSLLGNDGIFLTAGAGNTTDSGYLLFNANNLVVGFGNYALKVDKTGISKSSNGGVSFTAL